MKVFFLWETYRIFFDVFFYKKVLVYSLLASLILRFNGHKLERNVEKG